MMGILGPRLLEAFEKDIAMGKNPDSLEGVGHGPLRNSGAALHPVVEVEGRPVLRGQGL